MGTFGELALRLLRRSRRSWDGARAGFLPCALAAGALHPAQGEIKSFPKVDPYTKNDPGLIAKAGYASFGPLRIGDDHTSDQVESTLGGIPLLWVETAHFKLASGLPEYTISDDKQEKERLKGEIERLAARLPDVKVKIRKLDPWLRLHLFAQRLEDLYAKFQQEFELKESDFPVAPPDPKRRATGPYMGQGRFLGSASKFVVLVFDKRSSVGRYSSVYLGKRIEAPFRWHFEQLDSWAYLTAAEFLEGAYANDTALTCDVLTGVAQNLALGFRGYRVALPLAVTESIGIWFAHALDPRYQFFTCSDPSKMRLKDEPNWEPSVRARAEHKVFPTTSETLGWTDPDAIEWSDHLILWSRLDYLLARGDGTAGRWLRALKEPPTEPGQLSAAELAARARAAWEQATGADLAHFDADWSAWVQKTYAKK